MHRNAVIYDNKRVDVLHISSCISLAQEFFFSAGKNTIDRSLNQGIQVKWEKPQRGWFKLNTDGSALGNPGKAGAGGLIRNDEGEWVKGFTRSIGLASPIMAELWGLRDGLVLAYDLHISNLVINVDCKALIYLIQDHSKDNFVLSAIADECRQLLQRFNDFHFLHCRRETNQAADWIAKQACNQLQSFVNWDSPYLDLFNILCINNSDKRFVRL